MPVNLRDLARMGEFTVELASIGPVRCLSIKTETLSQATQKLNSPDTQPVDFARWLFTHMARKPPAPDQPDSGKADYAPFSTEELAKVTDEDLEKFSEQCVLKNRFLVKAGKKESIKKAANESSTAFLARAFRHYPEEQRAELRRMVQSLIPTSTLDQIQASLKSEILDATRYAFNPDVRTALESIDQTAKAVLEAASPLEDIRRQMAGMSDTLSTTLALYHNESELLATVKSFNEQNTIASLVAADVAAQWKVTQDTLSQYESLFRLPYHGELARLLDSHKVDMDFGFSAKHAMEALAQKTRTDAIGTPWIQIANPDRSISAFLELQSMGKALAQTHGFNDDLTIALRKNLGDWRDKITLPDSIANPDSRFQFYVGQGFHPELTDFPDEAFHRNLQLSGMQEPASEQSRQTPSSEQGNDEEIGLKRTNQCHDQLQRFERKFRHFIHKEMHATYGVDWPRQKLHPDLYQKWEEKKRKIEATGGTVALLIETADFTDYEVIICRSDNWREVFEVRFRRVESVRESLQRLYPIRLATMHSRIVTKEDELYLRSEVTRLLSAIK